jgi:hypothetical protein
MVLRNWYVDRLHNGLGEAFDGFRGEGDTCPSLSVVFCEPRLTLPEKRGKRDLVRAATDTFCFRTPGVPKGEKSISKRLAIRFNCK